MPVKLNTDDMKSDLVKTDNQKKTNKHRPSSYDNEIVLKKSRSRIIYHLLFLSVSVNADGNRCGGLDLTSVTPLSQSKHLFTPVTITIRCSCVFAVFSLGN